MALANVKVPVENVNINEIEVDPKFNCRTVIETDEHEASGGFKEFAASIAEKGQDTPVTLRKMAKGQTTWANGSKKPYFLVTGFRRYAAIKHNAEINQTLKSATIKAEIKEMTDAEARMLNVRENTARDDVSGPDLCFGIGSIVKMPEGSGLTQNQLASSLGMSQTYVGKLLMIWKGVHESHAEGKKIMNEWRKPPHVVTIDNMVALSKLKPEEQRAAYEDFRKKKETKVDGRKPDAWLEHAKSKCAEIGKLLGTLAKDGALSIEHGEDGSFFDDNVKTLVSIKKEATGAQLSIIAEAGHLAFEAAYNATSEEEAEGERPEPSPKKTGAKKKAGSKRSGANAAN